MKKIWLMCLLLLSSLPVLANDITPAVQQHITTSLDKMIENHGIFSLPVMSSGFDRIYQKYGANANLVPYLDVMSGYIAERMEKFWEEYVYKDIAIEDKIFRIHYNKNCVVSSVENLEYSLGYGGAYKQFRVGPQKDDSQLCMSGDNIGITIYTDNSMNNYLKKYIENFEATELVGDAGIWWKPLVDDYFALKESFLKQVPFKEIKYKFNKPEDVKNREQDFQTEKNIYNKFLYWLYVMYPLGYSEGKKFIYFTDSIKVDFLISREPLFTKNEEKYEDLLQETLKKADDNMKNIYFEIIK